MGVQYLRLLDAALPALALPRKREDVIGEAASCNSLDLYAVRSRLPAVVACMEGAVDQRSGNGHHGN